MSYETQNIVIALTRVETLLQRTNELLEKQILLLEKQNALLEKMGQEVEIEVDISRERLSAFFEEREKKGL